jgi:pilus assembly protein Flp/PilA
MRVDRTRGENIMNKLIIRLKSLVRAEEGQDLIEYAMLVALIALFCVVAVTAAGTQVAAVFDAIVSKITLT